MKINNWSIEGRIGLISAVIFTMYPLPILQAQFDGTARDYYNAAEIVATGWHSDAALLYLFGTGDQMYVAGKTLSWTYLFESSMDDSLFLVNVSLGLPVYSGEVIDTFSILEPLPTDWIDSDTAVAVAEANGGSDFRSNTGSNIILAGAGRGLYLLEPTRPVWLFTYTDTTTYGTTIMIYVDAQTGEYIDTQGVGIGDRSSHGQDLPKTFSLSQNYPNPFNPSTTLSYTVPAGEERAVSLEVYDVRGKMLRTLFRGTRGSGVYKVRWDGRDARGMEVGGGVYLARLHSGKETSIRKMTLVK
jgi:hypothetical protein